MAGAGRARLWIAAALVGLGCALVACDGRGTNPPSDATDTGTAPAGTPVETEQPAGTEGGCGPRSERFANLDWVPRDARFVALLDLDASPEARAAAHRALSALDEDPALGLPVFVGFGLGGLSLGSTTVASLLAQVELSPSDLVKVTSPRGVPLWVLPSSCDLGELGERVGEAWQMRVRETADGRVGTAPGGGPIPFDLVVLPGDKLALTPRGKHLDARDWLGRRTVGTEALGANARDAAERPIGPTVAELEAAPVRAAFQGRSLIDPDSAVVDTDPSRPRTLRADAEHVWIDGSLRAP